MTRTYVGYNNLNSEAYWKKYDRKFARQRVESVFRDLQDIADAFHRAGLEEEAKRTLLAIKTLKMVWMKENEKGKYRCVGKSVQSPT